jgi:hypothetical protein
MPQLGRRIPEQKNQSTPDSEAIVTKDTLEILV